MTELTDKIVAAFAADMAESERLKSLSNAELVAECSQLWASFKPVVEEMMRRLDPGWMESEPPAVSDGKRSVIAAALERLREMD